MNDIAAIIDPGCILCGTMGSHSHGTYIPPEDEQGVDDTDFMGIVIAPKAHYFGITEWGSRATKITQRGELDLVEYELKKYIGLLLKCNPNVHGLLWLPQYDVISYYGQLLVDNRDLFASNLAFYSYSGYARAQLKKMKTLAYQGYMGEKRKALVEKHGYDTKNAAHCMRLLRMGKEYLETGVVNVKRTGIDADQLMEIKRGAWGLQRIEHLASELFYECEQAYLKSALPAKPNYVEAEKLCINILSDFFNDVNK